MQIVSIFQKYSFTDSGLADKATVFYVYGTQDLLFFKRSNPSQNIIISRFSGSNRKSEMYNILIGG